MLIKNKSDSLSHIKNVLWRMDLSKTDKIILITILIEPYIQLEFSPTEYSKFIGISKSGINNSFDRLNQLKILKKQKKGVNHGNRYRYILDCDCI